MANIKEKLEKGYIHTRIIIEILGKPKEYVEKALRAYVQKIKNDPNLEVLGEDYGKATEQEGNTWTTFVELEMLMQNLSTLIGFCFDYMPASIEILAPEKMHFNLQGLSRIINDLQGKLHHLDAMVKQFKLQNDFLRKNTRTLLRNLINIVLLIKPKTIEELTAIIGVKEKELEKFLNAMIKENKVKKEGDLYSIVKTK